MNYNQFYSRKNQKKKNRSPYEKKNIKKLVLFALGMVLLGMASGGLIIALTNLFS